MEDAYKFLVEKFLQQHGIEMEVKVEAIRQSIGVPEGKR